MDNMNQFVFIGDSRIRQLYFELLKTVDPDGIPSVIGPTNAKKSTTSLEKAHQSLTFNVNHLSFQMTFHWMPILNESIADLVLQLSLSQNVPKILVVGSGAWEIKLSNGSLSALKSYTTNLYHLSKVNQSLFNNKINIHEVC